MPGKTKALSSIILLTALCTFFFPYAGTSQSGLNEVKKNTVLPREDTILILQTNSDFDITGKGTNDEWNKTAWRPLTQLDSGSLNYKTSFKMLYSSTGIYVLFRGEDKKITTKEYRDFEAIFNGDVFEVFFHPDPDSPVYFEYEVNPLNKELILVLNRLNGQSLSWIPWHSERKHAGSIRKMVDIAGKQVVNGMIQSWSAEIFFPYVSLGLLPRVPPKSGTCWNANFCRLDYDTGQMIKWSWSPTIVASFHEIEKFRTVRFE